MNYVSVSVKIISKPKQSFFEDNTCLTEVLVKFSQIKNNTSEVILRAFIWGKLGYDFIKYYRFNDYIILEGHIITKNIPIHLLNENENKKLEIIVSKIYPLIVNGKMKFNK